MKEFSLNNLCPLNVCLHFIHAFELRLGKYTVFFTNGELSLANTVYRKQCSDITALKLTYNV